MSRRWEYYIGWVAREDRDYKFN